MHPVAYPGTNVPPAIDHDLEKNVDVKERADELDVVGETGFFSLPVPTPALPVPTAFQNLNAKIESLAGHEAQDIARVQEHERHDLTWRNGYLQMAQIWYSANVTRNNLAVGLLGPLLFGLGFTDSSLTACFGCVVGSAITAYMSVWGAQSRNRTMVSMNTFAAQFRFFAPMSVYAASKVALARLMDHVAGENSNVRVYNLQPRSVNTDMSKKTGMVLPSNDTPELSAAICDNLVSPLGETLRGRFIWANWDVEEMKANLEAEADPEVLTIGLIGSPFKHKAMFGV